MRPLTELSNEQNPTYEVVLLAESREGIERVRMIVQDLRDFSRAEESAVKEGLGGRFWTLVHWTNWRVVFPMPGWQQERVARESLAELQDGRPVQWLVTNFPIPELNHTVSAYEYRPTGAGDVDFVVYDPNDPHAPGIITWSRAQQSFVAERLFDTDRGEIRAFRMYHGPLL